MRKAANPTAARRENVFCTRLNDEELKMLRQLARRFGLPPSGYVRHLIALASGVDDGGAVGAESEL